MRKAVVFTVDIVYNKIKTDVRRMEALKKEEVYTIDDIYALPDGDRDELICLNKYYDI